MTVGLSYLAVYALFIFPPIVVLGWLAMRREGAWWDSRALSGIGIMIVLAVGYTMPWDDLLIAEGVWWYGDRATVGTIWHVPIGEYLFVVILPILTAFCLFHVAKIPDRPPWIPWGDRALGAGCGLAISAVGWVLLRSLSTFYLGAILLWTGPILAIQWTFGLTALWAVRGRTLLASLVSICSLWLVDRIAIGFGVWAISETRTGGIDLLGLPIEEALFFLVTTVFVAQGIVRYVWTLARLGGRPALRLGRRRLAGGIDAR